MPNPLSAPWNSFMTDPKYSAVRHAAVTGLAALIIGILQAVSQTSFSPALDAVVGIVTGFGIKFLASYTV